MRTGVALEERNGEFSCSRAALLVVLAAFRSLFGASGRPSISWNVRPLGSIEQRVEPLHRFAQPARKRLCEPAMQDDGYHGIVGLYPCDLLA